MSTLIETAKAIDSGESDKVYTFGYAARCTLHRNKEFQYVTKACEILPLKYRDSKSLIDGLISDSKLQRVQSVPGEVVVLRLYGESEVLEFPLANCTSDIEAEWGGLLDLPPEGIEFCIKNKMDLSQKYIWYTWDQKDEGAQNSWEHFMREVYPGLHDFEKGLVKVECTSDMTSYELNALCDEEWVV